MTPSLLKARVRNETIISAKPEDVWAVTTDIGILHIWSPTVNATRALTGPKIGIGSQYELDQPGQPIAVWTVTHFRPETLFVWRKRFLGMHLSGIHKIEPHAGKTKNILVLEATGLAAIFLYPFLRPFFVRALVQENQGLKDYCEKHYGVE